MSYVTQGKVQVELNTQTEITIRISPIQDYMVKRDKEDYIVFTADSPKTTPDAKVFEKNKTFTTTRDSRFLQSLIHAAFKQTVIEIGIKETHPSSPLSSPPEPSFEIESIKIPATL